jgi:hypothetical protein
MIRKAILGLMVMLVLGVVFAPAMLGADGVNLKSTSGVKEKMDFGKIPLYFIPNRGQQDETVRYYSRTSRYTLWMTHNGIIFDCPGATKRHVSRLNFLKSNPIPELTPLEMTEHRHSIYKGNDPTLVQNKFLNHMLVS